MLPPRAGWFSALARGAKNGAAGRAQQVNKPAEREVVPEAGRTEVLAEVIARLRRRKRWARLPGDASHEPRSRIPYPGETRPLPTPLSRAQKRGQDPCLVIGRLRQRDAEDRMRMIVTRPRTDLLGGLDHRDRNVDPSVAATTGEPDRGLVVRRLDHADDHQSWRLRERARLKRVTQRLARVTLARHRAAFSSLAPGFVKASATPIALVAGQRAPRHGPDRAARRSAGALARVRVAALRGGVRAGVGRGHRRVPLVNRAGTYEATGCGAGRAAHYDSNLPRLSVRPLPGGRSTPSVAARRAAPR